MERERGGVGKENDGRVEREVKKYSSERERERESTKRWKKRERSSDRE